MLARAFQTVLVLALTLLLLAIGLVLQPDLLPTGVRRSLGIDAAHSRVLPGASGSYAFMRIQPGTTSMPVTYSRCQTLHYVINLNGAPTAFRDGDFIHDAVREISEVSGLEFEYDGTTNRTRTNRGFGEGPIVFDFAETADLHSLDGAAAIGGSSWRTLQGREYYTTGAVTFERDYFASLARGYRGADRARAIALHEIGHVLGLDHVQDRHEIMSVDGAGLYDLGPGDRAGLKILGSGPC